VHLQIPFIIPQTQIIMFLVDRVATGFVEALAVVGVECLSALVLFVVFFVAFVFVLVVVL